MQAATCGNNYISYTIQRGQTLYAIARQFNTTVADILAANPALDVQLYYAGDVICIPRAGTSCRNGTPYTIRRGDSFYLIAQRYGIPLANLLAANPGVDPARLQVGQVICLPTGTTQPTPPAQQCPAGSILHTVTAGQTFYLIAQQYGIALATLLAANPGVNPERLQIGQVICVPTGTTQPTPPVQQCPAGSSVHTVTAGQTFVDILVLYNISYFALRQANPTANLDALLTGQTLCIPPAGSRGTCATGRGPYVMATGDTLSTMAARFSTTVGAILMANPTFAPTDFVVGRIICLPANARIPG